MTIHKWICIVLWFLLKGHFCPAQQPGAPNFVFIITDDISAEDLPVYGHPVIEMPNLLSLSEDALVFDNAVLTTSSCSPSRNSIITGRYPHNTGAPEIHVELPDNQITFVQELKNAGYHTVLSGKNHMAPPEQLGFIEISNSHPAGSENWAKHLRKRPKDKPFFCWFASYDAHRDWQINEKARTYSPEEVVVPPYLFDGPMTREDLTGYYHEVSRSDYYLGEVLDELEAQGVLENTYIFYLSDNGRPFPRSKTYLYQVGIRTPLIVAGPKIKGGRTNSLISSIDLAPTILELANINIPATVQGVSFLELFQNHKSVTRELAFAERNWHRYSMHERMVRMGDWLYIRNNWPNKRNLSGESDPHAFPAAQELWKAFEKGNLSVQQQQIMQMPQPAEELYNVATDHDNLINLVHEKNNRDTLHLMRFLLTKWMNETGDNIPDNPTPHKAEMDGTPLEWYRGEMPGEATGAAEINSSGPVNLSDSNLIP